MANTQTSVPVFTSGQVLTAQQQTEINTGIPVFATTITRDAAFGGTGEKTLAEGQFAYIEATNATQYYDGANWQTVAASSGLTLVSTTTVGTAVSSVTISNCFSATHDNYKVIASGVGASASDSVGFQFAGLTTGYFGGVIFNSFTGVGNASAAGYNNISTITAGGGTDSTALYLNADIDSPFLAKRTLFFGRFIDNSNYGIVTAKQTSATSTTGFTITPAAGTLTGGTIRVYGYANS